MSAEARTYRYETLVYQGRARRTLAISLALHGLVFAAVVLWPYLSTLFGGRPRADAVLDAAGGGGGGGLGDSIGVELTGGLPVGDDFTKPPLKPLEAPAFVPEAAPAAAVKPAAEAAPETARPEPPVKETKAPPRPDDFLAKEAVKPPKTDTRKPKPEKDKPKAPAPRPVPEKLTLSPDNRTVYPFQRLPVEGTAETAEGVRKAKGGFGGDDLTKSGIGRGAGASGGGTGGGSGGGSGGGTGVSVGPGNGPGSGLGESWYSLVEKRIGQNWLANLGTDFRGTHHVSIEIVIRRDGVIEDYRVLEEDLAASEAFVRSAKGAIERSRRLIPFPATLKNERVTVVVSFDFPFRN
ncbi:MAG: TonB C-terminal domain-containing protein [Acidobacteria bacterium]|nr:TonB C-terminal domain-containing protein [Acidobacteriota bacterium]